MMIIVLMSNDGVVKRYNDKLAMIGDDYDSDSRNDTTMVICTST